MLSSSLVIGKANATVQLPCATISTSNQIKIPAGTRNVTLHGCALRGASASSGSAGGTVFLYSGTGAMLQVGDLTYGADTSGFHVDNAVINTTGSTSSAAQGLAAYRTQEMNLASLYFLGNSNQTGITLDGTGNYTGGTFQDIELGGFGTAVNAIGHQAANAMTTDWVNASTFLRLHIDCPTNGGTPMAGTYGINLQQGDGNTFTGGDVEGCSTALHLGSNAQNNTIVGLRNENSTNQVVADAGSSYNNWITGGTMFTGQLTDNGTRNSFLDTFHRSFNGLNGDWYGSQQDATVTNHFRLGTGNGNERGLLNRYQTDSGYRWTTGFSDASAGEQFYQVLDELNSVYRLSIGQYNNGQSSSNNQTVINAAGSGAVVLNGSSNSGTGGIVFGSGGANAATVGSINNAGNAQFNGTLQVGGPSTFTNSTTVKNQSDAEIDSFLWAGATANQKESYTYKDYTGASQWYMVKDASNNWALNSATGGLDSFKAYQSSNSGDTYINASNPTGHIRLNYETGSGAETDIYSGASSGLVAAFLGSTAIKFPGLAAASGHNCLQIDNSGYISNSGSGCGSNQNGLVNTGSAGQVAYYTGNGSVIAGTNAVGVNAGGTGASSAAQALQNLGAQSALTGVASDGALGIAVAGNVAALATLSSVNKVISVIAPPYNAKCDGVTDDQTALQAALEAGYALQYPVQLPPGVCKTSTLTYKCQVIKGAGKAQTTLLGASAGQDVLLAATGLSIWSCATTISDMTIKVDTSVDKSNTAYGGGDNTFSERLTGTAGGPSSAPITLAATDGGPINVGPAVFPTGATISLSTPTTLTASGVAANVRFDVMAPFLIIGKPITVNGAGPSGGNLTTTVSAVVNSTTITLAAPASTAVTNAGFSFGSGIQSPIAIGGCGIAFPEYAYTVPNALALSGTTVRNVLFTQTNATKWGSGHGCGMLLQSNNYNNHYDNLDFTQLWCGMCEAPPAYSPTVYSDRTPDTTTYGTMNFWQDYLPLIIYNGANRTADSLFLYSEYPFEAGVFQLGAPLGYASSDPGSIDVKQLYWEQTAYNTGETSRWKGSKNHFGTVETGYGNATATYMGDNGDGKFFQSINPLAISGNGNTFTGMFANNITDKGNDNDFICAGYGNHPVPRKWHCGPVAPREPVGRLTNSFIQTGNAANPFRNSDDLLFTCQDWLNSVAPLNAAGSLCTPDGTGSEITHSYLALTMTNGGPYNFYGVNTPNSLGIIGQRVPYMTLNMYSLGRCVGTASCTGSIEVRDIPLSGATNTVLATCAVTYTSAAWTQQGPCSVNIAAGTVGDTIAFRNNAFSNSPTEVDIAYVGFQVPPVLPSGIALVSPAMSGTPTAPTAAPGTNNTQVASTGFVQAALAANTLLTNVPLALQYFGDANEGALTCTSGTVNIFPGSHYYSTCTVSAGCILAAVTGSSIPVGTPLFLHCATGANIAGTISYSLNTGSSTGINNTTAFFGGGAGGGGFGAANGAAGVGYLPGMGGGIAGTSGVPGGTGTTPPVYVRQMLLDAMFPYGSTSGCGGNMGALGGSSGGPGGRGGGCIFITSPTFSFTGTCDVSGVVGGAGGSNTGGGGGGGGGVCVFRSPSMTNSGTFVLTGGAAGAIGTGTSTAGGAGANGWSKVFTQ